MSNAATVLDVLGTSIRGILSKDIQSVWFHVKHVLAPAVTPHTGDTLESLCRELKRAKMQLWIIGAPMKAAAITEIQVRPTQCVLWVRYLAGRDADEWRDDWATVMEEYARANNCAAIEWNGRPGWKKHRTAKHQDYKAIGITYRREL